MKKILWLLTLSIPINLIAQRVSSDLVMRTISYLSSDELGGRATTTPEEIKAALFIANQFKDMQLESKGNNGFYYDFMYKRSPNAHDTTTEGMPVKKGRNVIAFLDNKAEYTVVIGAHYDHLGYGHDGNSLDANPHDKIHNGADDNASGVAGVIELARYFSNNGYREAHNFLFMTFSGEELGLIGSKKWCDNPTLPLSNINYMLNMDMIGRLNDSTKKLLVYGIGTSPIWQEALEKTNHYFSLKTDSAGIGPSDQTSFYLKDIPVLHFFTGQHSDYHKPSDDAHKINLSGEVAVLEYMIDLIQYLDKQPKLGFLKTKNAESTKVAFKITMGIMPDYTFEGEGLRLDGVSENKPASNAGLQRGDVILQIGDQPIKNIQDYMKVLKTINKGDEVQVLLNRGMVTLMKVVKF